METRTHKLLILIGEEGPQFDGRDFQKLSQVIVGQYLTEQNPSYRIYLSDLLVKVIRGVPLKGHFYAGLVISISKQHQDYSYKIIEAVQKSLQIDVNSGNFTEALNSLNFLSEAMNASFFNSLSFINLLEDILGAIQKQHEGVIKKQLIHLLVNALPLCANSLHSKIPFQLKKLLQKIRKLADGDDLAEYLSHQFLQGNINNYSSMMKLNCNFQNISQFQSKFKLHIQLKNARMKDLSLKQHYRWESKQQSQQYMLFKKTQGAITRSAVTLLIDSFYKTEQILFKKIVNYLKSRQQQYGLKYLVQTLLLRALKSRHPVLQASLLLKLKNQPHTSKAKQYIQDFLLLIFKSSQSFELSTLLTFSKIFSFIVNNWKQDIDWTRYLQDQENFKKRKVLLKLICQKITLFNDKYVVDTNLKNYQPVKPINNQEEYNSTQEMEVFQSFQNALKAKAQAPSLFQQISKERTYEIFLQALLRRTSISQTHLTILQNRYHEIFLRFKDWDWSLINKIRNFFRNSFFHRLLYLRFMIEKGSLSFGSYINYVGQLNDKSQLDMIWIKMQLNELNTEFGRTLIKH